LHQLTGDAHWKPNDVDLVCTAKDDEDFASLTKQLERNAEAAGVPMKKWTGERAEPGGAYMAGALRWIKEYDVGGVCLQVNGVTGHVGPKDATAAEVIDKYCDLPGVVSFTYDYTTGLKTFTVPQRAREALFTRRVNRFDS